MNLKQANNNQNKQSIWQWMIHCKILLCLFISILFVSPAPQFLSAKSDSGSYKEYEVKAAFIYNFLKYVEWPEKKIGEKSNPLVFGVCGNDAFSTVKKVLENKKINDHSIKVIPINDDHLKDQKYLDSCHIILFSTREGRDPKAIISKIENSAILTIGEQEDFLDKGGIFNFVLENKKIRFEVNLEAAGKANIKIRSKVLRLAKRVKKVDKAEDSKKGQH